MAEVLQPVTPEQIASLASRLWTPEHLSAAGIGPDEGVFDAAVAEDAFRLATGGATKNDGVPLNGHLDRPPTEFPLP